MQLYSVNFMSKVITTKYDTLGKIISSETGSVENTVHNLPMITANNYRTALDKNFISMDEQIITSDDRKTVKTVKYSSERSKESDSIPPAAVIEHESEIHTGSYSDVVNKMMDE